MSKWLCYALLLVLPAANVVTGDELQFSERIDQLLTQKWDHDQIQAAPISEDAEFLRRVYLDLAGVIPTVSESRQFLDDTSADKRQSLIDELLRSPRHSTHLATTWRNLILPDDFDPAQFDRAAGLQTWLREQFVTNLRYDRIVSEFLTASGNEDDGPAIFYRSLQVKPEKLAASTAQIFLGLQIQCAQCHDHPFDSWTQEDFWGYAAFFAQLRQPPEEQSMMEAFRLEDLAEGDVVLPDTEQVVLPKFPTGEQANDKEGGSRRIQLSIWMGSRDNPFVAKAAVNRVWSHLFGRGLIHPVDDIGAHNPAVHPQLMDELTEYFVDTGFDLRNLLRVLCNTNAYQLSSVPTDAAAGHPQMFEWMSLKVMTADQLYDSLSRSMSRPSVAGDGRLPFARQQFITTMSSQSSDATDYQQSLQQALILMNGEELNAATQADNGLMAALGAPFFSDNDRVETIYLSALSRRPRSEEKTLLQQMVAGADSSEVKQQVLGDIYWALLNSVEFSLNH